MTLAAFLSGLVIGFGLAVGIGMFIARLADEEGR